jgi:hypothetical protein
MGSTEDLFEGPATELPGPISRGGALYAEVAGREARVSHLAGYSAFIGFSARHGVRAYELAADPARLIATRLERSTQALIPVRRPHTRPA